MTKFYSAFLKFTYCILIGLVISICNNYNFVYAVDFEEIETIDWRNFETMSSNQETDELLDTLSLSLNYTVKFAVNDWYKEIWKLNEQSDHKYLDLAQGLRNTNYERHNNEFIYRTAASQALAIAVAISTDSYDEKIVGVPKEEAKNIAILLVTSIAYANKGNNQQHQNVWGEDWQANLWAYYTGLSGWYLWDHLVDEEKQLIVNMIEHQANRFNNQAPPFWISRDNFEIYPGDSKIEENAWNAELLFLAYHMLPTHQSANQWKFKFIEFQLAAFSTPKMNFSHEIIHGRKAKEWINGYNITNDGIVINHNIIHPVYIASTDGVNLAMVATPLNKDLPLAAKVNLDLLYSALVDYNFEDGTIYPGTNKPIESPGGTIYRSYEENLIYPRDGSSEIIYYPMGTDWGTGIFDVFVNIDVVAYVYELYDSNQSYNYALYHAKQVLSQQMRSENGSTYISDFENNYIAKEEAVSARMALAYMTYWLSTKSTISFHNEPLHLEELNLNW